MLQQQRLAGVGMELTGMPGKLCIWCLRGHTMGIGSQRPSVAQSQAGELKAGDKIIYNFGVVYSVAEITRKTDKTIYYKVVSPAGESFDTHSRTTRYIGVTDQSL